MEHVKAFFREHAEGDLVTWHCQMEAAERFSLSLAEAERLILESDLLPARYQRNRQMFTTEQQLLLCKSRVAVVGCGGLGGYVIEELARLGVGTITAIDPDVFVEHNLNRQLLSSPAQLGCAKVKAAVARAMEVNPAVAVIPREEALNRVNGDDLLRDVHVAVDALDNIASRLELAEVCDGLGIPFVHGAIGGWYGQVLTQFPGERTLQKIYAHREEAKGVEKHLGNPSFTPAVVASLEVAETCKILLGTGRPLRNRQMVIDLLHMDIQEVGF
jgi:molybdopterin/thiamine biosynthesis adenylyltransferase